jgi:integrase
MSSTPKPPRSPRPKWPPFTQAFPDRYGRPRFYLRKPGVKRTALPGLPWSPEFMAAREKLLGGEWAKAEIGAGRTVAGTVSAALVGYYGSTEFSELGEDTRKSRRRILENFREVHGEKRIGLMSSEAIMVMIAGKSPSVQANFRKAIRHFTKWCVDNKLMTKDPFDAVKLTRMKKGPGHLPWTQEECEQYEKRHQIGTKARLAYEMLLQLGHSKCDVVRFGRQHVRNGVLSAARKKTKVEFTIPVMPELKAAIDAMGRNEHLTYLITEQGKPFTANGFGNWFRDRCDEANLPRKDAATGKPRCTPHGLRKFAAARLADRGATTTQLKAMVWLEVSERG